MGVHYAPRLAWSPEQTAELTRLLNAGQSANQIAAHFGVTRNVVIGKVDRDKSLPRLKGTNHGGGPRKHHIGVKPEVGAKPRMGVVALPSSISLGGGGQIKASTGTLQRGHENQALVARVVARKKIEAGVLAPPVMGYRPERFHEGHWGQQARVPSVLKLESHHCKFPIDLANGKTGFCGDVKEEHSSYCPHHAARCFNPESAAMRRRLDLR